MGETVNTHLNQLKKEADNGRNNLIRGERV